MKSVKIFNLENFRLYGIEFFFVDITGGGKRPETWATVVICLRQVSLNYIADIIEAEYSDSGSTPTTPGTELSVVLNNNSCRCTWDNVLLNLPFLFIKAMPIIFLGWDKCAHRVCFQCYPPVSRTSPSCS